MVNKSFLVVSYGDNAEIDCVIVSLILRAVRNVNAVINVCTNKEDTGLCSSLLESDVATMFVLF